MRIAELSRRSGASIPTIKYYVREEILPPGTATGRNQAEYSEDHVRRLRLIRALIDVGGLSVAAARQVLATVDPPRYQRITCSASRTSRCIVRCAAIATIRGGRRPGPRSSPSPSAGAG